MCLSCSQAGICCGVCRTNLGWHLEFKAKTVTDITSLPGTASFFLLCDENTHLYLTVPDMPRVVTEVRSIGDAAPSPEDCPLCQFCHGNSIVSTVSDTVLATVHPPPPRCGYHSLQCTAWGVCCCVYSGSAVLSHTWSCLVVHACSPANTPLGLSYGAVMRLNHPTGKTILKGFQGGNTKEGETGPVWQR